ncbi:Phloem protein 2-like A10 [Apostasia shenzhenica]|uniref:Phloem protein 2-like A10 n=1 Tax=Apostasia shenzhenica TaxID=1088818 RepID=A0A2I0A239_9ASPA|nr:Phloem protein 2-like A10 [Apostasia shenzhenica]
MTVSAFGADDKIPPFEAITCLSSLFKPYPLTRIRISFPFATQKILQISVQSSPMASGLAETALSVYRPRRRWLLLLAAAGLSGYGAYKVYHFPSVTAKRRELARLVGALVSVADAAFSSAKVLSFISSDLSGFLKSESDEIPPSLKQIAKIALSNETSVTISRVSEAMTIGIVRGFCTKEGEAHSSLNFSDKVLEKLLSNKGSGFASVVVGSFARNMVMALYTGGEPTDSRSKSDSGDAAGWVDLICNDKCRDLIADSIQLFVSTAVAVYLEKTKDVNTYDQFFSGLTNPTHEPRVKDMLVSVCNGSMETLVKTSREVLANPSSSSSSGHEGIDVKQIQRVFSPKNVRRKEVNGWIEKISSVLAVPRNRQFFLDVTSRLTFESLRSFLEFVVWKIEDGVKRGVDFIYEEVVERGLDLVRYLNAQAMFSLSFCLTLCARIANGTKVLVIA